MEFRDRHDAGSRLADRLAATPLTDPVVLALPRGGVPVGFEVAARLAAPLEVLVARKIGAPDQPELGVGAIAEGGGQVLDDRTTRALGLTESSLRHTIEREQAELARRVRDYRGDRPLPPLKGRTVIVVDDGLATGVTMRAAVRAVRGTGAARVIVAAPVGAPSTVESLGAEADVVVCLHSPPAFAAVGQWYRDFDQTSDAEVIDLLERARSRAGG
jgi:putative phosphoribosyl transferase